MFRNVRRWAAEDERWRTQSEEFARSVMKPRKWVFFAAAANKESTRKSVIRRITTAHWCEGGKIFTTKTRFDTHIVKCAHALTSRAAAIVSGGAGAGVGARAGAGARAQERHQRRLWEQHR